MRITVCLTDTRPEPWISGLRAALPGADIENWERGTPPADHAVVWMPPQDFIDDQPALHGLFNIGAGVDALLGLKLPPHARIVRLDDAGMSVQMAEYVCHALIRHFREFDAYETEARAGRWTFRKPRSRVDFPVNGWSRTPKAIDGVRNFAGAKSFDDFLVASRVLVCLLPVTPETRGIMRRENLLKLNGGKPGGYVINVARGAHLVEDDLIPLLDAGQLAGATLDVFEQEPLPGDHPFWRHPKINVTPHGSARTLRDESIAQIAGKIRALESGATFDDLPGVVDAGRGY